MIQREQHTTKVPDATVDFWITKVLTTAMGEIASDYLVHVLGPYPAVGLGAIALVIAMAIQLRARTYVPWIYWTAVAMVAVFGTMAADVLHVQFGVPYVVSTSFFAVVIVATFATWQATEHTLSIHSIFTLRRELFYWTAVMATFAFGTAAGDMTAKTMNLGYLTSGLIFTAMIAVPGLLYRFAGLSGIVAFWTSYVLTRPVGASFADWVGKPRDLSGLGVGDLQVIAGLTILIAILVVRMSRNATQQATVAS